MNTLRHGKLSTAGREKSRKVGGEPERGTERGSAEASKGRGVGA